MKMETTKRWGLMLTNMCYLPYFFFSPSEAADFLNVHPEYSPFHPDNVTYECAYSVHDNQPTFDIQFINADRNEDETEFTCESGQNIIQCLRELHHLFEDFKKENSGIKEVLKVMYVGTDTRRGK